MNCEANVKSKKRFDPSIKSDPDFCFLGYESLRCVVAVVIEETEFFSVGQFSTKTLFRVWVRFKFGLGPVLSVSTLSW